MKIFLIILGALLLLFTFILSLRVKVIIEADDSVRAYLKVLFFKIKLFPQDKKTPRLSDYTPKKIARAEAKAKKKEEAKLKQKKKKEAKKQAKKEAEKKAKEQSKEKKKKKLTPADILELVQLVTVLIKTLFSKFGQRLRLDLTKIHITVASEDPATTAIEYGVICQSVAYLVEILDTVTNVSPVENKDIGVHVDFLSDKPSVDIQAAASLRVWHVFDILFGVAFKFVKEKFLKSN